MKRTGEEVDAAVTTSWPARADLLAAKRAGDADGGRRLETNEVREVPHNVLRFQRGILLDGVFSQIQQGVPPDLEQADRTALQIGVPTAIAEGLCHLLAKLLSEGARIDHGQEAIELI
jgi:hypothetical protein